jgi:hypothetical protein
MGARMAWTARAAGVLLLAGVVAGCGSGGGSDGVASLGGSDEGKAQQSSKQTKDPEEAFRAFAQCMREHGVDMPDPQVSSDGGKGGFTVQSPAGGADAAAGPGSDQFKTANAACKHHLDGVVTGDKGKGPSDADREKFERQALAFAKCMRKHGIDLPDPTFEGDGALIQMGPQNEVDPNDPQLRSATEACQKQAGLPKPGTGAVTNGKSA